MINALGKRSYDNAVNKGFYQKPQSPLERHMLIVSEIAEATEEARKGTPAVYWNTEHGQVAHHDAGGAFELRVGDDLQKPEGELIELADAMIRIMDYATSKGWDLEAAIKAKMTYNETRPFMHGKKY